MSGHKLRNINFYIINGTRGGDPRPVSQNPPVELRVLNKTCKQSPGAALKNSFGERCRDTSWVSSSRTANNEIQWVSFIGDEVTRWESDLRSINSFAIGIAYKQNQLNDKILGCI